MAELLKPEEEAEREASVDTSATAIALALDHAGDASPPSSIDRFLAKQEELISRQLHHMSLEHWSKRVKLTTQALTLLVGLLLLSVVLWMAWEAHDAEGLVIKPFSVPPALAARGVTGEAVASKVMDKLSATAEIARPIERQKSVAAEWGENISIAIPETGISLSQVEQWLREKLGHQRRVTGDISLDPDGKLALDARIGVHPLPSQTGAEADLDAMTQKVAEGIYAEEQPGSWFLYLGNVGRWQEALESMQHWAKTASTSLDRAQALNAVGMSLANLQGPAAARPYFEQAIAADARFPYPYANLAGSEDGLGHLEHAYDLDRESQRRMRDAPGLTAEARQAGALLRQGQIANDLGDYAEALRDRIAFSQTDALGTVGERVEALPLADLKSFVHETGAALSILQGYEPKSPRAIATKEAGLMRAYYAAEDWPNVLVHADRTLELGQQALPDQGGSRRLGITIRKALALARLGRAAEAQALVDSSPVDCVQCLWARAETAAASGDRAAADRWYAEAVRLAPSLPQANEKWGRALLTRGQARDALARFDASVTKGPHFADAIEGRGEALMALGDAGGAVRAFQTAAKLTPRWGRLHLRWAEALAKLGQTDQARMELRLAGQLDLTPGERTELAGLRI